MKTLTLTRVGQHHMDGGLYKDEQGRYYADCNTEIEHGKEGTVYCLCPSDDPEGEPGWPYTGVVTLTNPPTKREQREAAFKTDYMMLDRMRTDCEYYQTAEQYNHAHASTIEETIFSMKQRWLRIPEDLKPKWLTWEQILDYEKKFGIPPMKMYHAQLQVTYVKIHTYKDYGEVMDYLLAHYDDPVVYLWDVADHPDDPMSYVGDFEIVI